MAEVILKGISKIYDNNIEVVKDLSFRVRDKEFVVIVGPSGCGKSTTLRMIAGLETISKGQLFIDEKQMNDVPPKDRNIAMVFQNYALYPHMTVFDNMAFGLKLRKRPKTEIKERVEQAANIVGMTDYLERKPKALSGGQRQRVALGRAIVRQPKVFLFDEPLSNLDAKLRVQMRLEIGRLQRELGTTTIYVTHDQTEAMTMADRIVVLNDGVLQQIDNPIDMYKHPKNKFVAGFIGSPAMNFLKGKVLEKGTFLEATQQLSISLKEEQAALLKGKEVILGIRPEDLHASNQMQNPRFFKFNAAVELIEPMGNETFVHFHIGNTKMVARIQPDAPVNQTDSFNFFLDLDNLHCFDAQSEKALF